MAHRAPWLVAQPPSGISHCHCESVVRQYSRGSVPTQGTRPGGRRAGGRLASAVRRLGARGAALHDERFDAGRPAPWDGTLVPCPGCNACRLRALHGRSLSLSTRSRGVPLRRCAARRGCVAPGRGARLAACLAFGCGCRCRCPSTSLAREGRAAGRAARCELRGAAGTRHAREAMLVVVGGGAAHLLRHPHALARPALLCSSVSLQRAHQRLASSPQSPAFARTSRAPPRLGRGRRSLPRPCLVLRTHTACSRLPPPRARLPLRRRGQSARCCAPASPRRQRRSSCSRPPRRPSRAPRARRSRPTTPSRSSARGARAVVQSRQVW
jgi:hypothetical protein